MDLPEHSAPALIPELPTSSGEDSSSERPSTSLIRSSLSTVRSRSSNGETNHRGSHDSKPRLSKDQQEQLEKHYRINTKPTTAAKKEFSDLLGVSVEKINNWFQNRRAKTKQDFRKKQEQTLYHFNEPARADPIGHPLADDSYIDNAFYQTMGMADGRHAPGDARFSFPQPALTNDLHGHHDPVGFSTYPIPEEPPYGEGHDFLKFFGLEKSNGYSQQESLDGVSALSEHFKPPSDRFDPALRLAQLQDQYHSSTHQNPINHASNDNSHSHLKQGYEDVPGEILQPTQTANDRKVSTADLATHMNANEDPDSLLKWSTMQSSFGDHGSDPRAVYQDAMKTQMKWNSDGQTLDTLSSTAHGQGLAQYVDAPPAIQQPMLPSQSFYGQQGNYSQPEALRPAKAQRPAFEVPMSATPPHQISTEGDIAQGYPLEAAHDRSSGAPQPDQMCQKLDELPAEYRMGMEPFARCDSGTSLLAESMDQVDMDRLSQNPATRSEQGSSSLAMRRQRRPAALGPAALRSISYSNGPVSALDPSAKHTTAADLNLRRIKSSTGVLNGRIQKSSTSPAQRSPFSATFNDVAAAAHRPRHVSNHSLGAFRSPSSEIFKTPTTPGFPHSHTPQLHVHHPSNDSNRTHGTGRDSETIDSVWSTMPDTSATTDSSIYHSLPPTAHTAKSYLSSPDTSMDPFQMAQLNVQSDQSYHGSLSPQSAPPWQPQFPPPYGQWGHTASPSLPSHWNSPVEGSGGSDTTTYLHQQNASQQSSPMHSSIEFTPPSAYPQIHASQDYPSGHSRHSHLPQTDIYHPQGQYVGPMQMQLTHQMHSHSPPQHNFTFPAHSESIHSDDAQSASSGGQQKQKQEIQFQQYEPREPADPSSLPPKARNTQPKGNYTFHNIMPDSFTSPKPASSPLKIACDVDEIPA